MDYSSVGAANSCRTVFFFFFLLNTAASFSSQLTSCISTKHTAHFNRTDERNWKCFIFNSLLKIKKKNLTLKTQDASLTCWKFIDFSHVFAECRLRAHERAHIFTPQYELSSREFPPPHRPWREPVNPYYANMGYARAPATSANDSEQQSMSSDADTLSLTDSSV